MQLGMSLAEYEQSVGPKNKYYHEVAEGVKLAREGVIPLDEDPTEDASRGHGGPSSGPGPGTGAGL